MSISYEIEVVMTARFSNMMKTIISEIKARIYNNAVTEVLNKFSIKNDDFGWKKNSTISTIFFKNTDKLS